MAKKPIRKRELGEGSITVRKDGRVQASIRVTKPNGERARIYHYTQTRADAADWLDEQRVKLRQGHSVWESDMTLAAYLEGWMQNFCINIRPSTKGSYRLYQCHIERHTIGQTPLRSLTVQLLQSYIVFLQEHGRMDGSGGLSNKTIRNLMLMLHTALKNAVGCNLISRNPMDYVILPKTVQLEIEILSPDEIRRLVEVSAAEPWGISIVLFAATGMRLGECLALRVSDVTDEDGICCLDIHSTLQRVPNLQRHEGEPKTILKLGPPKSSKSKRKVPLDEAVAVLLRSHLHRLRLQAEQSYGLYAGNSFLIGNALGDFIDPTHYRQWFQSMVQRAGIQKRVYPHLLRHSWASLACMSGISLHEVSNNLGHYDISFTSSRYVHSNLTARAAELSKMKPFVAAILPADKTKGKVELSC